MRRDKNFRPDPNLNPYKVKESPSSARRTFIDFNTQRVCPACGKAIKISYNFCKYCGVDLSAIEPIGNSDEISKQLAITAVTDPDPEVRKEAIEGLKKIKKKTKPKKFDEGKPESRENKEDKQKPEEKSKESSTDGF